jgi:hypothetical protein
MMLPGSILRKNLLGSFFGVIRADNIREALPSSTTMVSGLTGFKMIRRLPE